MKPWKDLSMKERGAFIRVGVKNGITSVDGIRDAYNKFACGGHKFDDGGPKGNEEKTDAIQSGVDLREYDEKYQPREMVGDLALARQTPHEEGLQIVSPEFDLLTLGRSIYNMPRYIGFGNTTKESSALFHNPNSYYRQGIGIIDDAKKSGVVRTVAMPHNINGQTVYIKDYANPMFSKGTPWYRSTGWDVIEAKRGTKGLGWRYAYSNGERAPIDKAGRRIFSYQGQHAEAPSNLFNYYKAYGPEKLHLYFDVTNGGMTLPITGIDFLRNSTSKKSKGGRLAHKFDGTSEPTQWMFRNKSNPNDLISEAQYEKLFNTGDERFKNYEGVRVAIPRQAMPRQQEVDHLYKDGRLDEITVRPDIVYKSDVRNIPALETTEEPISDERRKRFANSVGQQRRQAQMTPAEQWANYYNNLENLSPEDRRDLMRDRQFANYVQGMAMGTILGVPTSFTSPIFAAMGAADLIYNKNKKWWNYALDILAVAAPFLHLGMSTPWGQQLAGSALGYANKVGMATKAAARANAPKVGLDGVVYVPEQTNLWNRVGNSFSAFKNVMQSPEFEQVLRNRFGDEFGNLLYTIAKRGNPEELAKYEQYYNEVIRPEYGSSFPKTGFTPKNGPIWNKGLLAGENSFPDYGTYEEVPYISTLSQLKKSAKKQWKTINTERRISKGVKYFNDKMQKASDVYSEIKEGKYVPIKRQIKKNQANYQQRIQDIDNEILELKRGTHPELQDFVDKNRELWYDGKISMEEFAKIVDDEVDRRVRGLQERRSRINDLMYLQGEVDQSNGNRIYNRFATIDLLRAGYDNLKEFAEKHDVDISSFHKGKNGELIYDPSKNPNNQIAQVFSSGEGDIQIFGSLKDGKLDSSHYNVELTVDKEGVPTIVVMDKNESSLAVKDKMSKVSGDGMLATIQGNVSPGYRDIIKHNMDYVANVFGGKGFGSAAVYGIPHVSNDYDVIVTEDAISNKIKNYKSLLDDRGHFEYDLGTADGKGAGYYNTPAIDVNVILKGKNGRAEGFLAKELYRQFFPKEATVARREAQLSGNPIKIGRTPEELYNAFDPEVKTILDCLESGKSKHDKRIFGYIMFADQNSVREAIRLFGEGMAGQTYKKAPNFDFTNVGKNKELLRRMHIPYDFSDDPKKMQNLFDYYCLSNTMVYRALNGEYPNLETLNNVYEVWPNTGGTAFGVGTNNVIGASSGWGNSDKVRIFQIPVDRKGVTTPDEYIDKINWAMGRNLKFTAEQAAAIDFPATAEHPAITEGTTSSDIMHMKIPGTNEDISTETWQEISEKLQKIGIYTLSEGSIFNSSGEFASVTNNLPQLFQSQGMEFEPQYLPDIDMHSIGVRSTGWLDPILTNITSIHRPPIPELGERGDNKMYLKKWSNKEIEHTPSLYEMRKKYQKAMYDEGKKIDWASGWRNKLWDAHIKHITKTNEIIDDYTKPGMAILGLLGLGLGTASIVRLSRKEKEARELDLNRRIASMETDIHADSLSADWYKSVLEDAYKNPADTSKIRRAEHDYYQAVQKLEGDRDRLQYLQYLLNKMHEGKRGRKNKKSHGGPLELNDQYGIGKYINY